jgi:hypothetical protein
VPAETELEREIDRLYALPPGEFTAARDEEVKQLRTDGQRDLADQVKQVRKPTAAVWIVNRLAHEREMDVQRLLKAGEALTKSQVEAASGNAADSFTEARREEQRALERLADAARELAEREALGASGIERAIQTLRAASLTAEGRELLKRGRLTEELEPPGFDALSAAPKRRTRPAKPTERKDDREERRRVLKEARERVGQLRSKERELVKAARAAGRAAERAEREASASRKRADAEEAKAAAAADQLAAAETELERLE